MSQWAIADGRLVKKISNILLPLVGNVTICESPNLFEKSRNDSFSSSNG